MLLGGLGVRGYMAVRERNRNVAEALVHRFNRRPQKQSAPEPFAPGPLTLSVRSGSRACANLEAVESELGHLLPGIGVVAIGHQAVVQFLEVRIVLRMAVVNFVRHFHRHLFDGGNQVKRVVRRNLQRRR